MKERFVHQIKQTGKLRQLSLLLALLLVPIGAWAENYNLTVCGVRVTSDNASNVLGEGTPTVVFNAENSTLTLNGADITVENNDFIVSGLERLTVFLVGESYINCGNKAFSSSSVGTATVTFTTDATSNGSLNITVVRDRLFGEGVTPAYTNLSLKDEGDYQYINSLLGISVGGVNVTFFNQDDVLGDGKVSFTPAVPAIDNTPEVPAVLTLNGATIEPEEETAGIDYTNDEALTIALIGDNSVQGSGGCPAIRYYGNSIPSVSFVKGDETQHFSLALIAYSENDWIDGFDTDDIDYGDFFVFDDEDDGTYTRIIRSSVLGGTGSKDEPFLIKTPEDLNILSTLYNDGKLYRKYYQLTTDIDCNNLTDFVPIANTGSQLTTGGIFEGSFDGKGHKISNLTITVSSPNDSYCGLFGKIGWADGGSSGTIVQNLTLENCTIGNSNYCGAIAGHIEGGAISNCTVTNCTISGTNAVGGIVGLCDDSNVTVSGCKVTGTTSVSGEATEVEPYAGAIIGDYSAGVLSNNTYEYTVTTSTKVGNTEAVSKEDYTTRGTGNEQDATNGYYDITTNNGAVMYTKKLSIDVEHIIEGGPDDFYEPLSDYQKGEFYLAPGRDANISLQPDDAYAISSASLSYIATEGANPTVINLENTGEDGMYEYAFEMPNCDAALTPTTEIPGYLGLTVAGVPVTSSNAENVLDDEIIATVKFDAENSTLTINDVNYSPNDNTPFVVSGLDKLTVKMEGSTSIYSNAEVTAAFVSTNADAVLTFTTEEHTTLQLLNSNTIELASGFKSIVFEGYLYRDQNKVKNLLAPRPGMDGEYFVVSRGGYEPEGTTFNYEIDYVDEALEDATGTYNPSLTAADNNITLSAPCIVTVYAQYGTLKSAEKEGRYFGFAQSELNVPFGTAQVDLPAFVPATGDDIEINYEGIMPDEQNKIDLSEYEFGAIGVYAYFSGTETTPYTLLNDNTTLTVNIVPPAPTIDFDETKSYLNTDKVSITMPEILLEDENAVIMYSWVEDCQDGNGTVYNDNSKVTLTAGTGTLYAWVRYNGETADDAVYSERVSQVFTVKSDISEAYIPEFTTTATYTGKAIVPEFTVYDSEKTMNAIGDDNYTVSYQKSASTHMEDVEAIVEVGTYVITITGTGDTWGGTKTVTREFTVVYPTLDVEFAPGQTWATYYNAEERVDLPEGVNAYVVTDVNETTVFVQAISYVPQNTPVLLEQSEVAPDNVVDSMADIENQLIGTSENTDVSSISDGNVYVLYNGEFVKTTAGTIPANRGYLVVSTFVPVSRSLLIVIGDDATGISVSQMNKETMNNAVYNLQGQRMGSPRRGLNIVDGKKVFIK